ncbi:hypothetical protein [Hymenobacter sp. BT523]|nr:hypothetical protein [Hymenobacter sp. BT523]
MKHRYPGFGRLAALLLAASTHPAFGQSSPPPPRCGLGHAY